MENAVVDWRNEDEKAPDDCDSKVVSWLLKKGLRLGKIALVTGIVISSAPVVLPPLAVISAFGIAISVPYGVFLASYACTEKLMALLLPKAVPPSMEEYRALTFCGADEEKEDKIEETSSGEILEGKEEKLKEEDDDQNKSEIEPIPVVEENKDEGKAKDIEIQIEPAKELQKRNKGMLNESEKQAKAKKLDQDVNEGVEVKGIASDAVLDKDTGLKVNEIVRVTEQKTIENIENKATPDKKSPHKAKNMPKKWSKKTAQNGSGASPSPVEVVYSEKKIWEEMSALRTIVGYKEPRLPSMAEELKALYLFTGIQPPASVKNPSDLAEVTSKLRFLMAIVGVN